MTQKCSRKSHWLTVSLIIGITAISALFAYKIGEKRARLKAIRQKQIAKLQKAFALNSQCRNLEIRKQHLLSHPEAIARIAREEYDYSHPGEKSLSCNQLKNPTQEINISVSKSPLSFLIGSGNYPWRIPALAFATSLFVLGTIDIFTRPSDSKNRQ